MRLNKKFSVYEIKVGNKLLKITCRKIIERSKSKEGNYKRVKCSFKNPNKLFNAIRSNKKLYENWLSHTIIYIEKKGQLSFRPTIDRIDPYGHYYLYNMQVLSFGQNASKGKKK